MEGEGSWENRHNGNKGILIEKTPIMGGEEKEERVRWEKFKGMNKEVGQIKGWIKRLDK